VDFGGGVVVVFAVGDAGSCGSVLDIPPFQRFDVVH